MFTIEIIECLTKSKPQRDGYRRYRQCKDNHHYIHEYDSEPSSDRFTLDPFNEQSKASHDLLVVYYADHQHRANYDYEQYLGG